MCGSSATTPFDLTTCQRDSIASKSCLILFFLTIFARRSAVPKSPPMPFSGSVGDDQHLPDGRAADHDLSCGSASETTSSMAPGDQKSPNPCKLANDASSDSEAYCERNKPLQHQLPKTLPVNPSGADPGSTFAWTLNATRFVSNAGRSALP